MQLLLTTISRQIKKNPVHLGSGNTKTKFKL